MSVVTSTKSNVEAGECKLGNYETLTSEKYNFVTEKGEICDRMSTTSTRCNLVAENVNWSGCNFQENSWEILGGYRYNYRLVNTCVCSETGFRLRPCNTPDSTLGEISNKNNRVGLPMTRTVKRHAPGSDNWYSLGICAKTMNIDKLSQNATNGNTFISSPACYSILTWCIKSVPTLFFVNISASFTARNYIL